MSRSKLSTSKILVHRNLIKLSIEINFARYMLNLPNLFLLVYAYINPGKFTVSFISYVGFIVKM